MFVIPEETEVDLDWNPQPENFKRLPTGLCTSTRCTWYFNTGVVSRRLRDAELDWNIFPNTDLMDNHNGLFGWMPINEFVGVEEEYELKPVFEPERDSIEDDDEIDEQKKVKFDRLAPENQSVTRLSIGSYGKQSVASDDLFTTGVDDVLFEGELMKFKPGISQNF